MPDPDDPRQPSPRPGKAIADQGAVLLDGPRGAVVTLTPEAAEATGESLRRAAALAAGQRRDGRTGKTVRRLHPSKTEARGREPDGSDAQG